MPDALREWWPVLTLIVPLALGAAAWAIRKGLVSKDELKAAVEDSEQRIRDDLDDVAARLKEGDRAFEDLSRRIADTPSKQELHQVMLGISELKGSLGVLNERMQGQSALMERVEAQLGRHEQIFSDGRR